MATLLMFAITGFAGWVVSLYLWPYRPCPKCEGTGRNAGSNGKRHGQCRRCEGTGRKVRIGAKTVHRGRVSLAERRRKAGSK